MSGKQVFSKIRKFAIQNSESNDIHGFPHVERVLKNCIMIGEKLQANLKVLRIAALLHDLGRIKESGDPQHRNHAEISAELAKIYLENLSDEFDNDEISQILHAIQAHSFSNNITATSLEAKILSDADKLDAMGAIGIYRTIGFTIQKNGNLNDVIHHLNEKILKLKDLLYLEEFKQLARERYGMVLQFYKAIQQEK